MSGPWLLSTSRFRHGDATGGRDWQPKSINAANAKTYVWLENFVRFMVCLASTLIQSSQWCRRGRVLWHRRRKVVLLEDG